MRTFEFSKLVRDKIAGNIVRSGGEVKSHQVDGTERLEALRAKLAEEVMELSADDHNKAAGELADIQEVIYCLILALGKTPEKIRQIQMDKSRKFGSFANGDFIETVTIADDDPWIKHFEANPDRYPEITEESASDS